MKNLKFSFVIPAHNEENVIGECLESVLNQDGDFEIVVINDGSTDGTRKVVEGFTGRPKAIILENFSSGHSAAFARNQGAKATKGEWLIFLDADQIAEKGFLQKIRSFLGENPGIDGTDYMVFSQEPKTAYQKAWSAFRKTYPSLGFLHIIKKSVFDALGGFDEKIFYYEDSAFRESFHEAGYKYRGPTNGVVHHIEPADWKDFARQRRWQGRMAPFRYFLPCIFPPLVIIPFTKVLFGSKDAPNSVAWAVLDLLGRYVSLIERIRLEKSKFPVR